MGIEDGPKMPDSPEKKKQNFHSWHGQLIGTYMRPWFESGIFEYMNRFKKGPLASQYTIGSAENLKPVPTYEQHVRETYTPELVEIILKNTPKEAVEEFNSCVTEYNTEILPRLKAGEELDRTGFLSHVENLFRRHYK